MTTKNMAYDNPAYLARLAHAYGAVAAGSGAVTGKFIAVTSLLVLSLTATLATAGTSTATQWNGTATVTGINGQSFSLIRIFNTAAAGVTPALATATFGPFQASLYNGTATAVQTNAAGVTVNVPLYGALNGTGALQTGTNSSNGGFPVNQGDQLYVVTGTDATAVSAFALEYAVQPLANVTL